jgi:hypothetical protein
VKSLTLDRVGPRLLHVRLVDLRRIGEREPLRVELRRGEQDEDAPLRGGRD